MSKVAGFLIVAGMASLSIAVATAQQDMAREQMIATIEEHASFAPTAVEGGQLDTTVLDAMRSIPREEFVPDDLRQFAYDDRPLPIGYGQTISQPFMVALMTDLLDVGEGDKVLEIGTGSGYQAAVLSPLVSEVYTIEIVPGLGESATQRLTELGFDNVKTMIADGYFGWPEAGPFDGIIVTAAATQIPPPLIEQLIPGGRMVIPVGGPFAAQQLMLVEKHEDQSVTTRQLLPVRFVPFTRGDVEE